MALDPAVEPCLTCVVQHAREELALDAALRQHFDSRASVGLSKPYDEISDRTKRIVGNQLRDMVAAIVSALDGKCAHA